MQGKMYFLIESVLWLPVKAKAKQKKREKKKMSKRAHTHAHREIRSDVFVYT